MKFHLVVCKNNRRLNATSDYGREYGRGTIEVVEYIGICMEINEFESV